MDTHYLWLQERVRNKDLTISKVPGDTNPADLGTKHLTKDVINKLMDLLNIKVTAGRADACPQLSFMGILTRIPTAKPKR